jgi:hypothetical protein
MAKANIFTMGELGSYYLKLAIKTITTYSWITRHYFLLTACKIQDTVSPIKIFLNISSDLSLNFSLQEMQGLEEHIKQQCKETDGMWNLITENWLELSKNSVSMEKKDKG